jgi:hypothetical protein
MVKQNSCDYNKSYVKIIWPHLISLAALSWVYRGEKVEKGMTDIPGGKGEIS